MYRLDQHTITPELAACTQAALDVTDDPVEISAWEWQWQSLLEAISPVGGRRHFMPVVVSTDSTTEEMTPVEGPRLRGHRLHAFLPARRHALWEQLADIPGDLTRS